MRREGGSLLEDKVWLPMVTSRIRAVTETTAYSTLLC